MMNLFSLFLSFLSVIFFASLILFFFWLYFSFLCYFWFLWIFFVPLFYTNNFKVCTKWWQKFTSQVHPVTPHGILNYFFVFLNFIRFFFCHFCCMFHSSLSSSTIAISILLFFVLVPLMFLIFSQVYSRNLSFFRFWFSANQI